MMHLLAEHWFIALCIVVIFFSIIKKLFKIAIGVVVAYLIIKYALPRIMDLSNTIHNLIK